MSKKTWFIWVFFFTFSIFILSGLVNVSANETDNQEKEKKYVLEPIEVIGKQSRDLVANPLLESPGLDLSTSIVNEYEMEKQGAKTVIDALEYIPGAWVESRGRKVKQFFSVRGQKYPYPEYAIDGSWQREFHETPYFFSSADIEKIEVIRSSAALLKGTSGIAGIINIIPKKYREPETSTEVEYGTFSSYRFRLSHGATPKENMSYAVGLGSYHTDGPEDKNAAENMTNFRGTLYWYPMEKLSLQTNLFHIFGKRELRKAELPAAKRFCETLEKFDPFQSTLVNMKANCRHSENVSTELLLHYTDRDHDFFRGSEDAPHESTHEYDYEWGVNLTQALSLFENNVLRVGGLYNHWIAPNGKRFYVGRKCDLETISAVITDEHLFGALSLDAGLRWAKTHINEYGGFNINGSPRGFSKVEPIEDEWEPSIFNGSLGAAYYLSKLFSLHFNLAAGHVQPREGTLDVERKKPENELRLKLDLGARARLGNIAQVSVVGFLTQQKDAIVYSGKTETTNDGRVMELYLNRDQDQLGIEFDARTAYLYNIAQVFVNATAMSSRAESEGEMEPNEEIPDFIMNGGIYASRSRFDFNILGKYVSSYKSTRFVASPEGQAPIPQPLGDFFSLNASVGCSLDDRGLTRLYLNGENLTDKEFSTVVGYPDFGRKVTIGLRKVFR